MTSMSCQLSGNTKRKTTYFVSDCSSNNCTILYSIYFKTENIIEKEDLEIDSMFSIDLKFVTNRKKGINCMNVSVYT